MRKKKNINRDAECGYRFERCRECGLEWNVPVQLGLSPAGYICPPCDNKRKGARAYESSTKQDTGSRKRKR